MAVIIRMCIGCRERFEQKTLKRFKCENRQILRFDGVGRSFYICENCINSKKIDSKIFGLCKSKIENIREIINI
jgi:predicted RNA-binding protein YlxR (DUF448 family)